MHVSVTDAKGQLTQLVRRAESGEDIVLTRHGQPAARLVAARPPIDQRLRRQILETISLVSAAKATRGASAARSQDFLYGEGGMPA